MEARARELYLVEQPDAPGPAGLGYLATVRADGGPRVHPVSPAVLDGRLYVYCLLSSPKLRDLRDDGRYALHSFPPEESDDEAFLTGRATRVGDRRVIARLAEALHASGEVDWRLYELSIETATLRSHGPAGALPLAVSPRVAPLTRSWRAELPRPLAAVS